MKLKLSENLIKSEFEVNELLIKATDELAKYDISEFAWVREYSEALIRYVEEVLKSIAIGLALKLDVDPTHMQKSIKIEKDTLLKISNGEEVNNILFYKSLFSRLRDKFKTSLNFFKKFGFNKGKPLEPIKFKGKITYNPETKEPLTETDWTQMSNDIVDFLDDKIGNVEEEMVVRAGLFGKLLQKLEKDGVPANQRKSMSYNEIEDRYGQIPNEPEQIKTKFEFSDFENKTLQYAQQHAAEHLSIRDGSLKNKIIGMVRKQITEGLQEGLSAGEMTQRLFWIDPSDELGKQFSKQTIEAINRDWRRICVTEISYAMSNGYLASVRDENKGKKTYFVYSGNYFPGEKPNEWCNKWLGTIVLLVDTPLSDDRIDDEYAQYAIWIGKNNVGRGVNDQWICIPTHPWCTHWYQVINPAVQEFDTGINKIVYKIEKSKELNLDLIKAKNDFVIQAEDYLQKVKNFLEKERIDKANEFLGYLEDINNKLEDTRNKELKNKVEKYYIEAKEKINKLEVKP